MEEPFVKDCIGVKKKVIDSESFSAIRKDVLAKCYGGDNSRKKKLLKKQVGRRQQRQKQRQATKQRRQKQRHWE